MAENLSYEQTVKWGMTHESSSKKAKQVEETTNGEQKIRRLEEKVSRLQTDEKKGLISCKTCTRKHPQGVLCPGLGGTCYACGEDGHFRGATICKGEKVKDRKKGEKKDTKTGVNKVEKEHTESDSDASSLGRIIMVAAAEEMKKN